jgi:hypothetical protein
LTRLAGTWDSLAHAALILPQMSGLSIAASTGERTTAAIGGELGHALEAKVVFGEARPWDGHPYAEGKTCASVSLDWTGVAQPGPGGVVAAGELVAVGMVDNPVPEDRRQGAKPQGPRPPGQARSVAGWEGQEAVAEPLRHPAGPVGLGAAEWGIARCEGGAGLEDLLRAGFGRHVVVILDFSHAAEHLGEFAKAWCLGDPAAAEAQHAEWAHRLKRAGRAAMREWLEGREIPADSRARPAGEAIVTSFANPSHRRDYPSYLAPGWQLGSGPVEAACQTVIGQGMKGWGCGGVMRELRQSATGEPCSGARQGKGMRSGHTAASQRRSSTHL